MAVTYDNEKNEIGNNIKFKRGLGIVVQQFNPTKERKLLETISTRENLIDLCLKEARNCADYKPYSPHRFLIALNSLRFSSMRVCLEILEWRNGLVNPEPFIVAGENYLLKMIHDTEGLRSFPVDLFGFEFGIRNPFVFPCAPRKEAQKSIEGKRLLQAEQRKKERVQILTSGNATLKRASSVIITHKLKVGELILPRSRELQLPIEPDTSLAKLLKDLSLVAEEHWVSICHLESLLKAEEERYAKKQVGEQALFVAGSGWGLERWAGSPWMAQKAVFKNGLRDVYGNPPPDDDYVAEAEEENVDDDGVEGGDFKESELSVKRKGGLRGNFLNAQAKSNSQSSLIEETPKASASKSITRRRKSIPKRFSQLPKSEKDKIMAITLKSDENYLETSGRARGIMRTEDMLKAMEEIKTDTFKPTTAPKSAPKSATKLKSSPAAKTVSTVLASRSNSPSVSTPSNNDSSILINVHPSRSATAVESPQLSAAKQQSAESNPAVKSSSESKVRGRGIESKGPTVGWNRGLFAPSAVDEFMNKQY